MIKQQYLVFLSSRRRHTRWNCDWSSDVCSSDLEGWFVDYLDSMLAAGRYDCPAITGLLVRFFANVENLGFIFSALRLIGLGLPFWMTRPLRSTAVGTAANGFVPLDRPW